MENIGCAVRYPFVPVIRRAAMLAIASVEITLLDNYPFHERHRFPFVGLWLNRCKLQRLSVRLYLWQFDS